MEPDSNFVSISASFGFTTNGFFKWHHIGGRRVIEIDTFDGRKATYGGIRFEGSPRAIFWNAITRGVRKEVIEQFTWVEEQTRGYVRTQAEAAIDEAAQLLTGFARTVRNAAVDKDRILRGNGTQFPPQHDAGRWIDVSPAEIALQATALKAALFPPELIVISNTQGTLHGRKYQVALSFAGEQREYVGAVALALKARGVVLFYDEFDAITLWGKDGVEFFHQLFEADAAYVVMFISKEYVEKEWTRVERRAALSRAVKEVGEYVLPVRFDQTVVPGLPATLQYLRADRYQPAALAELISEKIGIPASASGSVDGAIR